MIESDFLDTIYDMLWKEVIIMKDYINVQYVKLPRRCHGAAVLNSDNGITVFLDPNDPPDVQKEGFVHEIEHIRNGDFDNIYDKNVGFVENSAHKKRL